jgi:hypothetical protein
MEARDNRVIRSYSLLSRESKTSEIMILKGGQDLIFLNPPKLC